MKKVIFKFVIMGALLMTSASVNAQFNLSNLGKAVSSAVGGNLSSLLSSKNNVSKEDIVGTWSYKEPAVIFESSNVLKEAGGKVAASTIEKKLTKQFTKLGITAGKFLVTFESDGTFSTTQNGKVTSSGTYTIDGTKIKFAYLQGTATVTGYAQMQDGLLTITYDSSKVLSAVSKVSKYTSNSTLSTISSLAGSFDGMKTGMTYSKYVASTTTTKVTTAKKSTAKKSTAKKTAKKTTKKKSTKKRK